MNAAAMRDTIADMRRRANATLSLMDEAERDSRYSRGQIAAFRSIANRIMKWSDKLEAALATTVH